MYSTKRANNDPRTLGMVSRDGYLCPQAERCKIPMKSHLLLDQIQQGRMTEHIDSCRYLGRRLSC